MRAPESRHLLFVLGMHRSGTSALCAALEACGATFGDHLLDPMSGVNDEGFWEDAGVVAVNDALLAEAGARWYSITQDHISLDWGSESFSHHRSEAKQLLLRGFGDGALEVVKDPRLCITAPFWLSICHELGIPTSCCVINRAPIEVARSLEKRDGFPLGYGLRLCQTYRMGIADSAPEDTSYFSYAELLQDPRGAMESLAARLPLSAGAGELAAVVRSDLRHHAGGGEGGILAAVDRGEVDWQALAAAIDEQYPVSDTLCEFAETVVARGNELTRIGAEHAKALETLDQRDADIAGLSAEHRRALATVEERDADIAGLSEEHRKALATIAERDEQIREFDRRLAKLGEEHSYALQVIRERDAQLDYLYNIPGVGRVIRKILQNAQG